MCWVFMATGTEGLPEFGRAGEETAQVADLRTLQAMQLMAGAGVSGESETQPSNQGPGDEVPVTGNRQVGACRLFPGSWQTRSGGASMLILVCCHRHRGCPSRHPPKGGGDQGRGLGQVPAYHTRYRSVAPVLHAVVVSGIESGSG